MGYNTSVEYYKYEYVEQLLLAKTDKPKNNSI